MFIFNLVLIILTSQILISPERFDAWVTYVVGRGLRMHIRQLLARNEEAVHHVWIEVRFRSIPSMLISNADFVRTYFLHEMLSAVAFHHVAEASATSTSTSSVHRRISTRASLAELCNYDLLPYLT